MLRSRAGEQRGAVMVLIALFAPVAILLAALVIDMSNWFEHSDHLQTQADAGVLAGALQFKFPCTSAVDSAIVSAAQKYSGVGSGTVYNQQVGGSHIGTIAENINQTEYPDPSQASGYQPNSPVDNTVNAVPPYAGPCEADMLDIKMNEVKLPSWFKAVGVVPYINAHARITIEGETQSDQIVPLAIESSNPGAAEAFFINEDTGAQIAGAPVVPLTDQNMTNAAGDEVWASSTFALTIPASTPDIGVIMALAAKASELSGTMTSTCSTSGVVCVDQNPGPSVLHVHTWVTPTTASQPGTSPGPQIEDVQLLNETGQSVTPAACSDAYFSDAGAACTIGIAAKIAVGSTPNPKGMTVSATINGTSTPLCYQTTGTYAGYWESVPAGSAAGSGSDCSSGLGPLTVPQASNTGGQNSFEVDVTATCAKQSSGTGICTQNGSTTFSKVQRSYAADPSTSGQIDALTMAQNGIGDANSFEACDTHDSNKCTYSSLSFTMALAEFADRSVGGGQPVTIHLFRDFSTAAQSGIVHCPPDGILDFNLYDSLLYGCEGTYVANGSPQDPWGSDPNCTYLNQLPSPPSDCIASESDSLFSWLAVTSGLGSHICGNDGIFWFLFPCQGPTGNTDANGNPTGTVAYCPNNWPASSSTPLNIPANDSRLIGVFITPYGSLASSNPGPWPIVGFAEFYVVGFPLDPCSSDPQVPTFGFNVNLAEVVGYFVKYIAFSPRGAKGNGQLCNQNSFGNCVAVLTQ